LNRKYNSRYITSIPFEKLVYDNYRSLLPKGIAVADEFNEFMKQRIVDLQGNKSTNNHRNGAIMNFEIVDSEGGSVGEREESSNFNIYSSTEDMKSHVQKL
jgi:hypothetical protein